LKHRCDSTACSDHTDSFVASGHKQFRLLVSNHKLLVSQIRDITSNAGDLHAALSEFHLVDELSKHTTLMLEISQVDFDQEIDITLVGNLRHRVIVALERLASNRDLKLEILAGQVAQSFFGMLVVENHPVYKCIGSQLLFQSEPHWYRSV